ncbi:MAG TPA: Ig-like domain-containing protein [Chthoniobacteraceae bacterium]|nr:Ig-like domain-containing protein [Chthoniobacteraceae bacterium]
MNLRSFFTDLEDASAGLTYTVRTNTNGGLVTTSINNSTDVLTLDYVDNAFGTANITIRATDTTSLFVEDTFVVTVNVVNDAPSFTKGADQTVGEDAGAQTVNGWATALSVGPATEAGQALNFIVGNNNPSLFSAQPAIAPNATLTYTPAANANGSATATVQIHDNGGTANGGVDTSVAQTFTINVTAVNDVPSFTKGADQTVNEDAGAQTVAGWATALSAGPANEAGQALDFIVSNNNNALFSVQPAIAANGTLTFTPATNANGSATVTVQIHDNGGTANGGVDTSAAQTYTINVTAVNDVPNITAQAPIALAQNHSRTIVFTDLTVTDADNPYPTGFTLTVQNGANYTRTANTITPTPGFVGTLSVPVQVNDGTANSNVFNLIVTVNPNAGQVATNATIAPDSGGGFRVSFLGAPGASYAIQFTNSLAPANWQPLGTVAAAANGRYSMLNITPANTPMRFYRSTEPYLNDFGYGLGAATLRGTAVLTNGALKLTDEVTGGSGAVTFDSIVAGPALTGFTARFNAAIGPSSPGGPADGISFAVGNLGAGPWGESGPGTPNSPGIGFDTHNNGPANENIGIHVWVNGTHVAADATNPYTNGAIVPVEISYDFVNGLSVRFNSILIFRNLPIAGFSFPATDGRFGISARTGALSERVVVDDVEITPR